MILHYHNIMLSHFLSQVNKIREELITHHRLDAFAQSSVFTVDEFQVSIGGIYAQLVRIGTQFLHHCRKSFCHTLHRAMSETLLFCHW